MAVKFRFTSPWEEFEYAVQTVKELLDQKKAYWLIGLLDDVDLYIDDASAEEMGTETLGIIYREILPLLEWRLEEGKEDREDIYTNIISLDSISHKDENEKDEIATSVCNKFEMVEDSFRIDRLEMRYDLKKDAISPKLSELQYNVHTHHMPDGQKGKCALINMVCRKNLDERRAGSSGQDGDITFVCDEEDIAFLIGWLEEVKQKIKGV